MYNLDMGSKSIIWIGMFVGGFVGGFIPSLWGADSFSMSGILFNAIGAICGIYIAFKISRE